MRGRKDGSVSDGRRVCSNISEAWLDTEEAEDFCEEESNEALDNFLIYGIADISGYSRKELEELKEKQAEWRRERVLPRKLGTRRKSKLTGRDMVEELFKNWGKSGHETKNNFL